MKTRTQHERVMSALTLGNGVCMAEAIGWSPPITRLAARVDELKKKGIVIEAIHKCPRHDGANHAFYRLPLERLF